MLARAGCRRVIIGIASEACLRLLRGQAAAEDERTEAYRLSRPAHECQWQQYCARTCWLQNLMLSPEQPPRAERGGGGGGGGGNAPPAGAPAAPASVWGVPPPPITGKRFFFF
eukprot:SAG22_NODE_5555_length_993_cov_2.322148_2_plen_112_part_01